MKKSFLMFAAGFGLLSLASCSNDDMPAANKDGGVTFTLRIPEEALTRVDPVASGAGTMATNIHYAVYKHGEKTPLIVDKACTLPNVYQGPDAVYKSIDDITLTLQLADNVNYDIVFYATSDSPAYVYDYATQEISLGDSENLKANQESYDAFYAAVSDFTTKPSEGNISVTLTRPFAQLNIGTNDLSNPTVPKVATSSVTITKVPASLNLLTGEASEVTDATLPVVFGSADLPSGYKFPVNGYSNLAMVYVLAGGNESNSPSTLSTVTLNTTPEEGKYSMSWDNVPLRTNYRTNIYGSLYTSTTNFKITIEPIFGEPDYNVGVISWDGTASTTWYTSNSEATSYTLSSPSDLAGLASLVNAGNTFAGKTITINSDFDLSGKAWTPIGTATRNGSSVDGNVFKGVIDGNGHVIKNLSIEVTGSGDATYGFVSALDGADAAIKNLTFEDVSIVGSGTDALGVAAGTISNGATVENVNVTSGTVSGYKGTGGIVGRVLANGTVKNCANGADITIASGGNNTGGIVGAAYYSVSTGVAMTIENCSNTGKITGAQVAGGIVGLSAADVKGCSNSGVVTGTGACIGGIAGEQQNCGSIVNCTNTANITSNGNSEVFGCGGIVGWIRYNGTTSNYPFKEVIEVSGCKNYGSVISTIADAGGIVGTCYNFGNIHNNFNYAPQIKAYTFAAGIVGNIQVIGEKDTYFPGMDSSARHIYVQNNESSTIADDVSVVSGQCSSAYAYDNTTGSKTTISGNYGVGDANTTPW